MLSRSHATAAGISSIAQSIAYVTASVAAMLLPLHELTGADGTPALVAFQTAHPVPLQLLAASMIALSVLGLGAVVPTTGALLGAETRGWVAFGRNVALLSLVVIAAYYTWFWVQLPGFVAAYRAGDATTRLVLAAIDPRVPFNWVTWFMFGGMGFWVFVVAIAVLRTAALPRAFVVACALKTGGFLLALAGVTAGHVTLAMIGTAIGALVGGTLYHFWLGVAFLGLARKSAR